MKKIVIYIVLLVACCVACTRTVYVPVEKSKTITKIEIDTIVEVVTPHEVVINTTTDTTSTISTTWATSTARVRDGTLYHDLHQHKRVDSVAVSYIYVHEVDSIPVIAEVVRYKTPSWCWWLTALALIVVFCCFYICFKK